jgi:hypothetical protein
MAITVFVCRKCKHHDCLVEVLEAHSSATLDLVRCQKICHGPVVGLPIAGRMEWFERVDGIKELAALVRATKKKANRDRVPKPLRKRRVKRLAGHAPRR